jgi:hypothetical protein
VVGIVHAYNPSTLEAESQEGMQVQGQPGLHRQAQDHSGCMVKPCLKKLSAEVESQ